MWATVLPNHCVTLHYKHNQQSKIIVQTMDYEQDYSKVIANDQQWYNSELPDAELSQEESRQAATSEYEHCAKVLELETLDNEDFE
jgi:hypothetical protein